MEEGEGGRGGKERGRVCWVGWGRMDCELLVCGCGMGTDECGRCDVDGHDATNVNDDDDDYGRRTGRLRLFSPWTTRSFLLSPFLPSLPLIFPTSI
jgi:hypothetical protein